MIEADSLQALPGEPGSVPPGMASCNLLGRTFRRARLEGAQERLEVFQATDDGFRLAEEDLRLRGPGDFIGVRQSGMPEMKVADLNDTKLIERARHLAEQLWNRDPYLRKEEHIALREKMHLFWQNFMAH